MADAMRRTITTAARMHNRPPGPSGILGTRGKLGLIAAVVLLAVLIAAYGAYWRYVAQQLEIGVVAWAEQQRALGNQVAFAWDGIGGFPFRFSATFRDPAILWHTPRGDVAWKGAALDASMAPWNLRAIAIRSAGRHDASVRMVGDASDWRLSTTGFEGNVTLHDSGALQGINVALQQPDATLADGTTLSGERASFLLDLPATPPADFNAPLGRVALDVKRLALPAGTRLLTEDPVDSLTVDATVKGPVPPTPLKDALAAWRDAGGVVELHNFGFAQGPLAVSGNATLALDANLQPEGAGTVTTSGLSSALEILIKDGLIPPDRALAARATVRALEKPGADGRPQATLGLSLQNRTVSFGPVPLAKLQRIEWP